MSKIQTVRLINISYNNGNCRISDETLPFQGESTLIRLSNGGGKSVLVQMLIAPFVQKRYRNTKERPFLGFFGSKKPSFILVEWALDGGAGYVLTGMMVRKSIERDSNLDIISFIGEYKEPCAYDIHSLPVVDRDGRSITVKGYSACKKIFEGFKAQKRTPFFWYDMESGAQQRQYFEKLREYGIHNQEWQSIIRKINEEESGLSKLFDDAKDETGLLEKWVLPTIEDKLSGEENRMKKLQDVLSAYIREYHRKQDTIRRGEGILAFQEEAGKIQQMATAFSEAWEGKEDNLNRLIAYRRELERLRDLCQEEASLEEEEVGRLQEQFIHTEHERFSESFYEESDRMEAARENLAVLNEIIDELFQEEARLERERNILEMAEYQEEVEEAAEALARAQEALKVHQAESAQLEPERAFLGYQIRLSFDRELRGIEDRLQEGQGREQEEEKALEGAASQVQRAAAEELSLTGKRGQLEGQMESFSKEEKRFCSKWRADLKRLPPSLEYAPNTLEDMQASLDASLKEEQASLDSLDERLSQNEVQIREGQERLLGLEKRLQEERLLLAEVARKAEDLAGQRQKRQEIMKASMAPEELEFDKPALLSLVQNRADSLDQQRKQLERELDAVRSELMTLQTGQNVTLSPELAQMFSSLGISLVYGLEWLEKAELGEEQKKALVRRHPLLPYSLLLLEEEVERLREGLGKVYTAFPVPIVSRSDLARELRGEQEGGERQALCREGGTYFYILFNEELLDEEALLRLTEEAKAKVLRQEGAVENKAQEYQRFLGFRDTLAGQSLTRESYEETLAEKRGLEASQEQGREAIRQLGDHLELWKKEREQMSRKRDALAASREKSLRRLEALQEYASRYEAYLPACREYFALGTRLEELSRERKEKEEARDRIRKRIEGLRTLLLELRNTKKEILKDAAPFEHFDEVPRPSSVEEETLQDLRKVRARYQAITEKAGGELRKLEEDRAWAAQRLHKMEDHLSQKAAGFQLLPPDWEGIRYSTQESNRLLRERRDVQQERDQKQRERADLKSAEALAKRGCDEALKAMLERCEKTDPLPREEISGGDYEARKKEILKEKREHQEEKKRFEDRVRDFQENLSALAEFEGVRPTREVECEDLMGYPSQRLRAATGNYRRAHAAGLEAVEEARKSLQESVQRVADMPQFQEDFYQKPTQAMLKTEILSDPKMFQSQLDLAVGAMQTFYQTIAIDIANMDREKKEVAGITRNHVHDVHEQIGRIDRNSTIKVRGRDLKMLRIEAPRWDDNCSLQVEQFIEEITRDGVGLLQSGGNMEEFLGHRVTTRELYNYVVGIHRVRISIYKLEANREVLLSWKDVAKNSGGEGFVSAFIVLCALLHYMRSDEIGSILGNRNEGKVVLMDNPFAQTNASHLLKPLRDMADKNNVQLICLTGLGGESIMNRFDNVLPLCLYPSALGGVSYLKLENPPHPSEVLLGAQVQIVPEEKEDEPVDIL